MHTAASQLEPGVVIAASELNLALFVTIVPLPLHTFVVSAPWISCHCCCTCRKEKILIMMLCESHFPVVLPSVMWDKYLFWHFPHLSCLCGDSGSASPQSNHHLWFLSYKKTIIPELSGLKNHSEGLTIRSAAPQGEMRRIWLEYRLQERLTEN